MRAFISGLEIMEADGRIERTPAFRSLMERSGRYNVRSGLTYESGTLSQLDGRQVEVAFDSWYWTGRGYRAKRGFEPYFRLTDIADTLRQGSKGLLETLTARTGGMADG